MTDDSLSFPSLSEVAEAAWCDNAKYLGALRALGQRPRGLLGANMASAFDWFKPYSQIKDVSYGPGDVHIKWYHDGTTNVAYNCIDRHLPDQERRCTAIIWEGDDPADDSAHHLRRAATRTSRAWPMP